MVYSESISDILPISKGVYRRQPEKEKTLKSKPEMLKNQGIVFKKNWGRGFLSEIRLHRRELNSLLISVFVNCISPF